MVTGLIKAGVPSPVAHHVAAGISARAGASHSAAGQPAQVVHAVQLAFAHSTQTIFYIMAGVMAATFVVALIWLPGGRAEEAEGWGTASRRRPRAPRWPPPSRRARRPV